MKTTSRGAGAPPVDTDEQLLSKTAWIDESIHLSHGLYVLAAAVAPTDEYRAELRAIASKSRGRIHWHDEQPTTRQLALELIDQWGITNVVSVGAPVERKRQERARRKCLEQLAHRLCWDYGVSQVILEARTSNLNKEDQYMIDKLRSSKVLPTSVRFDFEQPSTEPMLWVPDCVAGAVAAARKGDGVTGVPLRLDQFDVAC